MTELALSRKVEKRLTVGTPTTSKVEISRRAEAIERLLQGGVSGISAALYISEVCGHPGITITKNHVLAECFNADSEDPREASDAKLLALGGEISMGWNNGYVLRNSKKNL